MNLCPHPVCVCGGGVGDALWCFKWKLGERKWVIYLTASLKFPVVDCVCENFRVLSTPQITKDLHGQFHT